MMARRGYGQARLAVEVLTIGLTGRRHNFGRHVVAFAYGQHMRRQRACYTLPHANVAGYIFSRIACCRLRWPWKCLAINVVHSVIASKCGCR